MFEERFVLSELCDLVLPDCQQSVTTAANPTQPAPPPLRGASLKPHCLPASSSTRTSHKRWRNIRAEESWSLKKVCAGRVRAALYFFWFVPASGLSWVWQEWATSTWCLMVFLWRLLLVELCIGPGLHLWDVWSAAGTFACLALCYFPQLNYPVNLVMDPPSDSGQGKADCLIAGTRLFFWCPFVH